MIRTLPLLLLLLAACGGGVVGESLPRGDGSPDSEACRREAVRDPEVQRIAASNVPGNLAQQDRVRLELRDALPRAFNACMIRRGARPPGGVEPVRRGGW